MILGIPAYNQSTCIAYIIDKLQENGFNVRYTHPNMLFISWSHWVPNYVREEIKKKTGVIVDGFGNIVKNKEKTDCSSYMRTRSELSSNITALVDQEYFNVTVLSIQMSRSQCALSFSLYRILRIQDCTTINLIFKCYSCLNSLFIYSFKSVDECNSLFP